MRRIIGLISVLGFVVACAQQQHAREIKAESEAITRAQQTRQAEAAQRQAAQQDAVERDRRRKQAEVAEAEAATHAEVEQIRAGIRGTSLPVNYREQIDAYFVATLIDPDSRKIEIVKNPYGSLVCGYINARNSFGGYTGRQFFTTYFNAEGKLAAVQILPLNHEAAVQQLTNTTYLQRLTL